MKDCILAELTGCVVDVDLNLTSRTDSRLIRGEDGRSIRGDSVLRACWKLGGNWHLLRIRCLLYSREVGSIQAGLVRTSLVKTVSMGVTQHGF